MSASAVSSKRIPLPLLVISLVVLCPVVVGYAEEEKKNSSPQADLEIRGTLLDSEIVIRTTRRLAHQGGILNTWHSLSTYKQTTAREGSRAVVTIEIRC